MNHSPLPVAATPAADLLAPQLPKTSRLWVFIALLLALCVGRAAAQDDDYIAIIGVMDQADALSASGKLSQAHDKYLEAQQALTSFQRANPGWNTPTVSSRIKYVGEKAAATSGKAAVVEPTVAAAETKAAAFVPKSPVKLLDAGSEPRKVLRFHPAAGDKQTIVMTMKMDMEMGMAGIQLPAMDIPPMQLTMDIDVKNISADGEIAYQMVFTDASVDAGTNAADVMAAAMKTALGGMRGLTGSGKMTTQGIVKSVEMKLPAGAAPQLSQTAGQMKDAFASSSTAWPEEAIGVGAKWEYQTKVKSQGLTTDQTITYELVALDGDQLTLRSAITQSAANQKMESPAMPGMKVDLNKLAGSGTANTVQDLTRIMPLTVNLDEETKMNLGMNAGKNKQNMDMKLTMKIKVESK